MKRDNDLLRQILMDTEKQDDYILSFFLPFSAPIEDRRYKYHIDLLCDAGLMVQISEEEYRITNAGHDYLEAIRQDTI